MKLKLTKDLKVHPDDLVRCGLPPGSTPAELEAGRVVELADGFGEKLLAKGAAELVTEAPVETAAVEATEKAAPRPARKRRRTRE